MSDKKKKDRDREPAERLGSVSPSDDELTKWLNLFWARDEFPERIEVRQLVQGARGEMVFQENFRPNDRLDIERVNKLANEIMAACQHDCDVAEQKRRYQIDVRDTHRSAEPMVRGIGPLLPKSKWLAKAGSPGADDGDDDEVLVNGRTSAERYVHASFDQVRWDKQRYDLVMGDLLKMQSNIIVQQQSWIERMTERSLTREERLQDALDRQKERDIYLQREQMKLDLMKDGWRVGRNALAGFFGSSPGAPQPGAAAQGSPASMVGQYGASPERALVDNFLEDCERENLSVALFGEWDDKDGALSPVADKPGIFSPQQFAILFGVRTGHLPPAAIDVLMPGSTDARAITPDQLLQAQGLKGMTDGITSALMELRAMRQRAHEAPSLAANSTPTATAER